MSQSLGEIGATRVATKRMGSDRVAMSKYYEALDELRLERDRLAETRRKVKNLQDQLRRAKAPRERRLSPTRVGLTAILERTPSLYGAPRKAADEILADPLMGDVLEQLQERRGEFQDDLSMLYAGIGMNQVARQHFNRALDEHWNRRPPTAATITRDGGRTLVVGSGVHAAIFTSIYRRRTGFPPIVVDMADRAGGSFAMSAGPSFYLNSRNRPGPLSIPGDEFGALNYLPGAPIQPSMISGSEYITNDEMAFAVRVALFENADVYTGQQVSFTSPPGRSSVLTQIGVRAGNTIAMNTVVVATGIGEPRKAYEVRSDRYLTYQEFMARMDSPFPLRGMQRVAVLGAGDAGKTAIEALTGQGPPQTGSASMDWPKIIDWFGVPDTCRTRATWEANNRSRYKPIGKLLPNPDRPGAMFRVKPYGKPSYVEESWNGLLVNGMPYDYVIDATGYNSTNLLGYAISEYGMKRDSNGDGRTLARQFGSSPFYLVGPAAQLDLERMEPTIIAGINENSTSIFRYADKTARLAQVI
jgi:hypothetical protein